MWVSPDSLAERVGPDPKTTKCPTVFKTARHSIAAASLSVCTPTWTRTRTPQRTSDLKSDTSNHFHHWSIVP